MLSYLCTYCILDANHMHVSKSFQIREMGSWFVPTMRRLQRIYKTTWEKKPLCYLNNLTTQSFFVFRFIKNINLFYSREVSQVATKENPVPTLQRHFFN
jgi:hypothetical protein